MYRTTVKRRLLNILAAISLLLCVATLALWVRSYWAADAVDWEGSNDILGAGSQKGRILIVVTRNSGNVGDTGFQFQIGRSPNQLKFEDEFGNDGHEWLGFGYAHISAGETICLIMLPLWFICILFSLGPAIWLTLHLKHRRATDTNACPTCGYDLRATPDRCPECGTEVTAPSSLAR
jgi:hypothetical protein